VFGISCNIDDYMQKVKEQTIMYKSNTQLFFPSPFSLLTFCAANTFGYNSKSELIDAVMGLDDYDYDYDQIGNRITATSSVDSVTSEMDYLCNALNQYTNITSVTVETPTYDADGNMLTNGDWTYTWNGENRLITASNTTTVVNFKYDYMGRRFEKSVEDGATKTFIYDGWNPILETIQHSTFSITNSFAWGLDLSGSMQGAGGIGGLLSTVQDGDIYFSCFDANGNVTDYVDETGDIAAHYEYNPFGLPVRDRTQTGGIISSTGNKKDDFNFRFSTKYLDIETDLYYYGYRYYDPELGRWINREPFGENGGLNLYGFVGNAITKFVDYLGLYPYEISSGSILNYDPDELPPNFVDKQHMYSYKWTEGGVVPWGRDEYVSSNAQFGKCPCSRKGETEVEMRHITTETTDWDKSNQKHEVGYKHHEIVNVWTILGQTYSSTKIKPGAQKTDSGFWISKRIATYQKITWVCMEWCDKNTGSTDCYWDLSDSEIVKKEVNSQKKMLYFKFDGYESFDLEFPGVK